MRGVEYVVSDAHAGLKAARRAVLGGATWQRCQYHLAANAIQQSPNNEIRKSIGSQLGSVWNALTVAKAKERLVELVQEYRIKHPKFADWLENNIPEGLNVFALPEEHRKRMRTSNAIERCVQQELKRRTRKIRVFPNPESLLRLATAILQEIDEAWAAKPTPYIDWSVADKP
jgi:transposase-like protein